MQVVCDKCGAIAAIPDESDESVSAPKGWRRLYVKIDVYTARNQLVTHESEGLHACPMCTSGQKPGAQIDVALEVLRQNGCAAR